MGMLSYILHFTEPKPKIDLDFCHLLSYNPNKLKQRIAAAKNLIKDDEESLKVYNKLCMVFDIKWTKRNKNESLDTLQ